MLIVHYLKTEARKNVAKQELRTKTNVRHIDNYFVHSQLNSMKTPKLTFVSDCPIEKRQKQMNGKQKYTQKTKDRETQTALIQM